MSKKRQVNFRLDPELHDRLKERANAEGCNVIDIVLPALERVATDSLTRDELVEKFSETPPDGTQPAGDPEKRVELDEVIERVKASAAPRPRSTQVTPEVIAEVDARNVERFNELTGLDVSARLASARSALPDPSEVGSITQRAKELVREEGIPMPQAMARARREAGRG